MVSGSASPRNGRTAMNFVRDTSFRCHPHARGCDRRHESAIPIGRTSIGPPHHLLGITPTWPPDIPESRHPLPPRETIARADQRRHHRPLHRGAGRLLVRACPDSSRRHLRALAAVREGMTTSGRSSGFSLLFPLRTMTSRWRGPSSSHDRRTVTERPLSSPTCRHMRSLFYVRKDPHGWTRSHRIFPVICSVAPSPSASRWRCAVRPRSTSRRAGAPRTTSSRCTVSTLTPTPSGRSCGHRATRPSTAGWRRS